MYCDCVIYNYLQKILGIFLKLSTVFERWNGKIWCQKHHKVVQNVSHGRLVLYSWIKLDSACSAGYCGGTFSHADDMKLFLTIFPRISLHCKLVSVQSREYKNGPLILTIHQLEFYEALVLAHWYIFHSLPLTNNIQTSLVPV